MKRRKPSGYWTLRTCKADAKRFKTRTEWHSRSGSAFSVASKNGWLKNCCAHMIVLEKPKGFWTKEACRADAIKYKSRSEWENNSGSAYGKALKMGWLNHCCAHMERLGTSHLRKLYAFEHPDKSVYVGLTFNYQQRYGQHMTRTKLLIEKYKIGGQKFVTFDVLYRKEIAAKKEQNLIEKYRRSGWRILNKVKGGGLGGSKQIWDLAACKKDALKYKSKREWAERSAGAWDAARSNGWIDNCSKHMKVRKLRNGTWSLARCLEDAHKYKTRGEWKRKSASAYGAAWSRGWLNQCCAHMTSPRAPKGSRTLEECKVDARKYESKSEWQRESAALYKVAYRNGWVDECCIHMISGKRPQGFWDNKDRCMRDARKFESKTEWQKKSRSAYKAAIRNGWLVECCESFPKKPYF